MTRYLDRGAHPRALGQPDAVRARRRPRRARRRPGLEIVREGSAVRVPRPGPLRSCADLEDHGAVVAAIGYDDPVLYRGPSGASFRPLYRHRGPVAAVAVSPDGARVASAGWDDVVVVAETSGRRLGTLAAADVDVGSPNV